MTPAEPDHSRAASSIERDDDSNNALTAGAPQQTVVNGWTAIDYLRLLSKQLDENSSAELRDDRPAAMLGLCVAGLALLAFTGSAPNRALRRNGVERSPSPDAP